VTQEGQSSVPPQERCSSDTHIVLQSHRSATGGPFQAVLDPKVRIVSGEQ
jgi:hypothetical protein